jgi:predicted DNA-binding transcriptional regulator YafY
MRADRLVAAILVLQARGRVTAVELAAELEISERTARRDLESLALAGVPVYSQRGRNGGWSLVGGARTDLTGLTAQETRALFMAVGPVSADAPELRSALRKLMQAVPASLRQDAEAASRAVIVDERDWTRTATTGTAGHREALARAIVEEIQVCLGYASPGRPPAKYKVHPLGLVSKAGAWYLVADTDPVPYPEPGAFTLADTGAEPGPDSRAERGDQDLRVFRVSRVSSVKLSGEPARRPPDFDLEAVWRTLIAPIEERGTAVTVRAHAERRALESLRRLAGSRLRIGPPTGDGRVEIAVDGPEVAVLVGQLAGFGADVEIVGPAEALARLSDLARELSGMYRTGVDSIV